MVNTVVFTVIIFSVIIFLHELGHFIAAKSVGIRVNEFALGMGPKLWSKQKGETLYSLRAFPIGGFVSMEGDEEESGDKRAFCNKKPWQKFVTIAAGPFMNFVLCYVVSIFMIITMVDAIPTTRIHSFKENSVTSEFLQAGDDIVAVDGHRTKTSNQISERLMQQRDGIVDITVIRDGQELLLKDVRFNTVTENNQQMIVTDFIMVGLHKTVLNVPVFAVDWTKMIISQVWSAVTGMFKGQVKLSDLSGPVGVAQVIGAAANSGNFEQLLTITVLLTVNIGIFNLLPIPAMDGGRLLFILLEGIRRKPIKPEIENTINFVGIVVLMGFTGIILFKDIIQAVMRYFIK